MRGRRIVRAIDNLIRDADAGTSVAGFNVAAMGPKDSKIIQILPLDCSVLMKGTHQLHSKHTGVESRVMYAWNDSKTVDGT